MRVSASSAPKGSSSSSSRGSRMNARASATRCDSPPDSVAGHASARGPSMPTSSSAADRVVARACPPQPDDARCARPASRAAAGGPGRRRRAPGGASTTPSAPGSRPARARSSVLFPEPLAPSSATTSPSCSSRSTCSMHRPLAEAPAVAGQDGGGGAHERPQAEPPRQRPSLEGAHEPVRCQPERRVDEQADEDRRRSA